MIVASQFKFIVGAHVPLCAGATPVPLRLSCTASVVSGVSDQVNVTCVSSRDVDVLEFECSFNGQAVTDGCKCWPAGVRALFVCLHGVCMP